MAPADSSAPPPRMAHRRFGRTGIRMPVFSCGGMRYQHSWQDVAPEDIPEANQANLEATIERALAQGIHHIETARGYGSSELQLGKALSRFPRETFLLQTKVAPCADPAEFAETVAHSLSLLQVGSVDLLSIHGINNRQTLDWTLGPKGCLQAARRLQQEGRCRFIGFSTHGSCDLIEEAICTGEFDYVNLHWYYIFQWNEPAIRAARRQDMGVFIISPNDKGGLLYKPSPKLLDLCHPLHPMQFNDLFCLRDPDVHTLSLGASRPTDFDLHLETLPLLPDPHTAIEDIEQRLNRALESAAPSNYFLLNYRHLIPPYDQLPGQVNVAVITFLWLVERAFDMTEYARFRYNLLGNGSHWFPGQQAGPARLPALRAALEPTGYADTLIEILRDAHDRFKAEDQKRLSASD